MKNGWDKYASQKRIFQKGYFRKYRNRSQSGKTAEASSSNSVQQSREGQKEDELIRAIISSTQVNFANIECKDDEEFLENLIQSLEKQAQIIKDGLSESSRKEDVGQTHQEGRQGIQESDQGRCETEEANPSKTKGEKVKKQTAKEKKHESRETKAYEKKEDKKESKTKKK